MSPQIMKKKFDKNVYEKLDLNYLKKAPKTIRE